MRIGILAAHLLLLLVACAAYCLLAWSGLARFNRDPMHPGEALYFAVVTQSTTGFGDVLPENGVAKAAVVAHIVASLLVTLGCTTRRCGLSL